MPKATATDTTPAATVSPLRALLSRLAEAKARARQAGKPHDFGQGMNAIPNRFHIDSADGDAIAALKIIAEDPETLLAELG